MSNAERRRRERKKARKLHRRAKRIMEEQAAADLAEPTKLVPVEGGKKRGLTIGPGVLAKSRLPRQTDGPRPGAHHASQVFKIPRPAPGVIPEAAKEKLFLAMDQDAQEISTWAAGTFASGWFDGPVFMGYPALSLLALMPEYRRMAEVLATECTRRWIRIGAANEDDTEKLSKVTKLDTKMKGLDVRGACRRLMEYDAFMGRSHLYLDVGDDVDDRAELKQSIGNGRDAVTAAKFKGRRDFLRGVKPIEAVWCYPSRYNATNPLRDDWYAPQTWFCQAQEVHVTRLLRFVGREVPDLLKPAYMFGGLSLSQLMKPYVDRWIMVVQAVADLLVSFSTSGIKTNLDTALKPEGDHGDVFDRIELFNNLRSNRGAMVLDKDSEEFFQFNTPLSELGNLVTKYQEFLCSISGEPVVKLLGIQPAGLNASSQGEITSWLDWCEAYREKFFAEHLTAIIDFCQLSLFGEVDPDIIWTWESLRSLDPKEKTEQDKVQAETDATYVEIGAFSPQEIRAARIKDPESPYYGIDELTPDEPMGPAGGSVDPEMAATFPGLAPGPPEGEGQLGPPRETKVDLRQERDAARPDRTEGRQDRDLRDSPREERPRGSRPAVMGERTEGRQRQPRAREPA